MNKKVLFIRHQIIMAFINKIMLYKPLLAITVNHFYPLYRYENSR